MQLGIYKHFVCFTATNCK